MLNRLLFAHQKPSQVILAVFGALVGMLLLLGGLQLYFDIQAVMFGHGDLSKPQYLVINKEVNMLNTLFGGQKGFSQSEIDALKKVPGVRNVSGLTSSRFKVSLSMGQDGMQGMPGMYTELFFEAVPNEFIDVDQSQWQWKEGDSLVPIVVPRDYIKLYNFGFAPTQGLPQVTEGLVGLARFKITINGPKGNAVFRGKLAGFSERINTILAPQSFIDYANKQFAGVEPGSKDPSRVIVECEGPATIDLIDYFSANGYETSADAIRNSKMYASVRIMMTLVVFIAAVIIVLALLCFILYSQLLMSRSAYELQTLIRIGYNYKTLAKKYIRYYAIIIAGVFVFTLVILYIAKLWFNGWMQKQDYSLSGGLSGTVFLGGIAFTVLFIGMNSWTIVRQLRKL